MLFPAPIIRPADAFERRVQKKLLPTLVQQGQSRELLRFLLAGRKGRTMSKDKRTCEILGINYEEFNKVKSSLVRGVGKLEIDLFEKFDGEEISVPQLIQELGLEDDPQAMQKTDRIRNAVHKYKKNLEQWEADENLAMPTIEGQANIGASINDERPAEAPAEKDDDEAA